MRKGHTQATPVATKRKIQRKRAANQLKDLLVCREFYYDNRTDYTHSEIDRLDNAVKLVQKKVDLC